MHLKATANQYFALMSLKFIFATKGRSQYYRGETMERRDFIKSAVASAVTAGATLNVLGQAQSPARVSSPLLVRCRPTCNIVTWGALERRFR